MRGLAPAPALSPLSRAADIALRHRDRFHDGKAGRPRRQRQRLGRLGEPDDIAGAAVFLASRAGAWMTGQTLIIDGGWSIKG